MLFAVAVAVLVLVLALLGAAQLVKLPRLESRVCVWDDEELVKLVGAREIGVLLRWVEGKDDPSSTRHPWEEGGRKEGRNP